MAVAEDKPLNGESELEEQVGFVKPGLANQPKTSRPDTPEAATTAPIAEIRNTYANEEVEYGKMAARLQWEE